MQKPPSGICLAGVFAWVVATPCGFDGKFTATDPLTRHEQNFVPKANLDLLFVRDKYITGYWYGYPTPAHSPAYGYFRLVAACKTVRGTCIKKAPGKAGAGGRVW